ncbi:hypothetical protein ZWY2020_019547 [Hordeum vulgare]|nr:hypothetical protein ZWY2020_019547 [Hordeum vulgare]
MPRRSPSSRGQNRGGPIEARSARTTNTRALPSSTICAPQRPIPRAVARACVGPPDLAEPRSGLHRSHEREAPSEAHRATTKPSLPRRQTLPPRRTQQQ